MKKFFSDAARKRLNALGFSSNGQLTPKFFEEWAKRHMMKPVCKVVDPDGEILLADSHEPIVTLGVYRTGYAIHRSGLEIGNYHEYPIADFAFMTRQRGIEQRIDEALAHARQTQKQLKDAGFYDAERTGRFNLRLH